MKARAGALVAGFASLALSGCLLAAGGAAAAGSGVYVTSRGAEAIVQGGVGEIASTTRQAFANLSIEHRGHKESDDGQDREVFGRTEDAEVTVDLDRRTENATKVEVRVKKSAVTWDKDMARRILEEIRDLRES